MATNLGEVCSTVREFLNTIPPEKIKIPVGLLDPLLAHIESVKSSPGSKFTIKLERKLWGNVQLKGLLKRYSDHAEILFCANLNQCWKRFVICKEAAHLLIDTGKKDFTYSPIELVQQMIAGAPSLNNVDPLRSEQLAFLAAIEMLVPYQLRPTVQDMVAKGDSDLEIAKAFYVPEYIVNYMVRSRYWEVSNNCHEKKAK